MTVAFTSWESTLDDIFKISGPTRKSSRPPKPKTFLDCHRVLMSDQVFNGKEADRLEKEKKEQQKEVRRLEKERSRKKRK